MTGDGFNPTHKNDDVGDCVFFFKHVGYYLFTSIVGLSITYYLLPINGITYLPIYIEYYPIMIFLW